MAGVFISYRRSDSDVAAGRLADDLAEVFGRESVFRDVDHLEAGQDYTKALDHALDSCAALIVVIGRHWATIADAAGRRRLEDPQDWVRLEVSRGLERDVRVIPVLIAATMPTEAELPADLRPLLKRQALELSDRHWRQDLALLAQALEKVPGMAPRVPAPGPPPRPAGRRRALLAAAACVMVATAGWWGWARWRSRSAVEPRDLSPWVRIRDSGQEGAAAGLALVTAMEASLAQQRRPVTLSARYLYEKAKSMDRFGPQTEGTDLSAAIYIAETFGAPPEDLWPYVAGSRDLPKATSWQSMDEAAVRYRARTFRLRAYEEIPEQLAQGRPVLAAVNLTAAWMTEEAARTGVLPQVEAAGEVVGLHAIVVVAFSTSDSSIRFANSWGVGWGADGFGTMPGQLARQTLKEMWAIEVPPPGP